MRPTSLRPAGLLLTLSVGLGSPLAALTCAPALAAEAVLSFDLPAAPLEQSLRQIAREGGLVLAADPALLQGRQAQAVRGSFSARDAARIALQGSGLGLLVTPSGTLSVEALPSDGALQLGATTISSAADSGNVTEGTRAYTIGSTSTATRLPLSIRETPQSVTVISQQRIRDENMKNLDDVLLGTTGVTLSRNGSERSNYYARGQQIDLLQVDGIPTNIANAYSLDAIAKPTTQIYDHVEVVRGANGLLQGAGNPSAAVNLVRKRPTAVPQVETTLTAGSWDTYGMQLDAGNALNSEGTLRGRTVLSYGKGHSFRDEAGKEDSLVYGIVEADLSERDMLTLGMTYQKDRNRGYDWSGLPISTTSQSYDLPRSTALVGDWNYLNKANTTLFGDYQHQFDNGWKWVVAVNQNRSKSDFLGNYTWRTTGDNFTLNPRQFRYDDTQTGVDTYASGQYQLFGRSHDLAFGANWSKDDFDYHGGRDATYNYLFNVTDPGSFNPPKPQNLNVNQWKYNITTEQEGIYGATRLSLSDSTKLILGSRVSWYKTETMTRTTVLSEDEYSANAEVTPYAGIVQTLNDNFSAYASYTEIFKQQSLRDANNSLLEPVTGASYEIGLKGETLDKRFGGSLALFQNDQSGLGEEVSDRSVCATDMSTCYEAAQKVRTHGVDMELYGAITPDWNLQVGYTWNSPKYAGGENKGSAFATNIPRHLFKATTDYRLPAPLEHTRVGASLYAQTHIYTQGTGFRTEQAGYALLGLHAVQEINENLEVQFNLANAFDRTYYQTVEYNQYNNFYGDPRNFTLTLRARY